MTHTIEVEVDATGQIHPMQPEAALPQGRAILVWDDTPDMEA